ncbi:MAG: TolC family protein [Bacteroidota bacterium]
MKLTNFPLLLIVLLLAVPALGQTVDFDKVVPPVEVRAKTFEDYLVQLAWNNTPTHKKLYTQLNIAEKETKLTKREWTQDITASFNVNEISLSNIIFGDRLDLPVFFPIYNVGASVNLGTFVHRPVKIRIAEEKEKMAQFDISQRKLLVRREVLEAYEEHRRSRSTLQVRVLAEQDAYGSYLLISEKFKNNDAKFEDFNAASSAYYTAKEGTVTARSEVEISRIRLEELIGVPLADAQRMGPEEREYPAD